MISLGARSWSDGTIKEGLGQAMLSASAGPRGSRIYNVGSSYRQRLSASRERPGKYRKSGQVRWRIVGLDERCGDLSGAAPAAARDR